MRLNFIKPMRKYVASEKQENRIYLPVWVLFVFKHLPHIYIYSFYYFTKKKYQPCPLKYKKVFIGLRPFFDASQSLKIIN